MITHATNGEKKIVMNAESADKPTVNDDNPTQKQHRNPMAPSKSLSESIAMVRQIYEIDGTAPIHKKRLADMVGYSASSSSGSQVLSTLGQYGLISYFKNGSTREAKVSDLAIQIIVEEDREALAAACLKPKIFKQLWDTYGADRLPSADTIAHKLVISFQFKPFAEAKKKAALFLDACKLAGIGGQPKAKEAVEEIPDDSDFFDSPQISLPLADLTSEDLKRVEFSPPDVGPSSPGYDSVMLENKADSPNYNKVTLAGKTWELVLPDECTQQDVEKFKQYLSMVVSPEQSVQAA